MDLPQEPIVKGDARSISIAAASIVAKVTRDRLMADYHRQYPQYGFSRHKGYPTRAHRQAVAAHGPSPIHRKTFKGVREHVE
jgi:ribonuclease HII